MPSKPERLRGGPIKIVVFGATGNTGRQVVEQALAAGHEVTAFVRHADGLPIRDERLRLVVGDTTRDPAKIEAALQGQDAAVSALGRRKTFKSENLIARSLALILPAMERAGVSRFILVSAFGVGESHRDAPLVPRVMYRLLLSDIFADKRAAEEALQRSRLDWTIVYPVLLTDGPMTARYRVGERLALSGLPKIARADVAHFILEELARGAYVRKTVAISY